MMIKKRWLLLAWIALSAAMSIFNTSRFKGDDRSLFLPGETSHGHHQIEMACNACHTPWMGVKEDACIQCHGAELAAVNDSHPKSKFTDPRNADRLLAIDASNCVTCHREHVPEQTHAMGVTVPDDYCYHCHQQTLQDRPSHKDFAFNSCATAGCHNYHDNTALYENFLAKHANEPATKPRHEAEKLVLHLASTRKAGAAPAALHAHQADAPKDVKITDAVRHDWASTAHAAAAVNCSACHMVEDPATRTKAWSNKVSHTTCATCHAEQTTGFLSGMHGMRLAQGLSPMRPAEARIPMKPEAAHHELNCMSCHSSHQFDRKTAAVESCLQCHNDSHSLAYKDSSHYALWQQELSGALPAGSGVSCATCHLPRETHGSGALQRVVVQHNQNLNLRPNEKMIRGVCMNCHGVGFSIDALADRSLIDKNFIGHSSRHVESIDLVLRRLMEQQKQKQKAQPGPKN